MMRCFLSVASWKFALQESFAAGPGLWRVQRRTVFAILVAALSESSCSQTLTTVQPAFLSCESVSRSRWRLASNLSRHHSAFDFGHEPCVGQACQKQESTKTATFRAENSRSARRRKPAIGSGASTAYRSPCRCTARRIAISGRVSRVFCRRIRSLTAADDGFGVLERLLRLAGSVSLSWRPTHTMKPQCH